MRICTYIRQIDYFDRYYPHMRAIAKCVDEFHIFYLWGTPKPEWSEINFHQFKMRKAPKKVLGAYLSRQKFYKETEKVNPDIYYVLSDSWQMEYMRYCAKHSSKPLVIRVRGNHEEVEKYIKSTWYNRKARAILRKRCYSQAEMIIPITRKNRDQILSWGLNDKVSEPVYPGVDFNDFGPQSIDYERDPYNLIVGYAGRLNYEKGCDILPEIARLCPNMGFLVAGRLDVKVEFPENVKYLGRIPHEEIPFFYNSVDVFLLPSRTEGFPYVFLEAYASQKKIVASKQVFPDELPLYGVLAERPTPEALADALLKVKDLPPRDIRSEISGYTWDAFGERIVGILENIM